VEKPICVAWQLHREAERMLTVDDYEAIRRCVVVEGTSQREAARRLGRSRKTVKKALKHAVPPGYRRAGPVACPVIDEVKGIIDAWLSEDVGKPRKQRHTMTRIHRRLVDEHGFAGGYDAVRRYIVRKKQTSGELFFPLSFGPAEEAQVDWGEACWEMNGTQRKVNLFCMRLCHSTAAFVRAYEKQDLVALLDGHVRAFEFFGGVPRRMCYDNMKSVVITVGKGSERVLTQGFRELRSWYIFETRFCNVARGNEKGHVENLVKHAQRNFMTPVPMCTDLAALNAHLARECEADLDHAVAQRGGRTRRELLGGERAAFLPLPEAPMDACRRVSTFASKEALVRVDNVSYSVPVVFAYRPVVAKMFVDRVEVFCENERIAAHARSYEPGYCLEFRHYIALLEKKPGGIINGRPFKGQPWGEDLERMRRELEARYDGEGTRKFVRVLLLFSEFPETEVKKAVAACVKRSAFSDEAVRATLTYRPRPAAKRMDLTGRPGLDLETTGMRPAGVYDGLLGAGEAGS